MPALLVRLIHRVNGSAIFDFDVSVCEDKLANRLRNNIVNPVLNSVQTT